MFSQKCSKRCKVMATTYGYADDVPELYNCIECEELMVNPTLTDCCGYHFCEDCIVKRKECPNCYAKPRRLTVDRQMMAYIEALKVRCTHSDKGCQWTGQRRDLVEHLNKDIFKGECDYQEISCYCRNVFQRAKILDHMAEECDLRLTNCEYCGLVYHFINLQPHYSKCSKYPIKCPYDCGITELQRRCKKEHVEICGEQEVECKYGCDGKLKRKDLEKHYQDNKDLHLSLLSEENAELKKEIAKLKKDNAQCARKRRRYAIIDSDSGSDMVCRRDSEHM